MREAIANGPCKGQAKVPHNRGSKGGPEGARSRPIKPVERVEGADRKVGLGGLDQDGEFYLRGGNGEDIDLLAGQGLERLGGDAGVAAHTDADDGYLGDVGRPVQSLKADRALGLVEGDTRT